MTDKNSILVAYDYLRGEPRGHYKKTERTDLGDCIDCHQCVKVCPVAIDIRNGTQLECTNCTACIDACDNIMVQIDKPKGLIRYASELGIAKREKLRITPRIIAYSSVLMVLIGVLVLLLATRKDLDTTILRTPGMLYQQQDNEMISNLYTIKLLNKTHQAMPIRLELESEYGSIKMIGKEIMAQKESKAETEFFVLLPKNKITNRKTEIRIGIYSGDLKIETIKTNFLGPVTLKN